MIAKNVIGRRIVAIKQAKISAGSNLRPVQSVFWIVLDNGIELIPVVQEMENNYAVDFVTRRRKT